MIFNNDKFDFGIKDNPLTHSVFSGNSEGEAIAPSNRKFITTESLIHITTESGQALITEN